LLIEKFISLMRELKRFPTVAALRMKTALTQLSQVQRLSFVVGRQSNNVWQKSAPTAMAERAMKTYWQFAIVPLLQLGPSRLIAIQAQEKVSGLFI
jgi:hypothetical protein